MNRLKTESGADFFLKLAEADPASALECLKRTVGQWSIQERQAFKTGRRQVIWALERIAIWRNLFPDAARLLLCLAEAENEAWGNNATGEFTKLFIPAPGRVSCTEATPEERFIILKESLESKSKKRRLLGLKAAESALQTSHFSRMIGAEFQGLKEPPNLWKPKTYGEWWDAYRRVWNYLIQNLDGFEPDEREIVIDVLLHNMNGLISNENLAPMIVESICLLIRKSYVDKPKLLAAAIRVLHFCGKDFRPEIKKQLECIKDDLTGTDFASLLRRYVGMDLLEDKIDSMGKHIDKTAQVVSLLAADAIRNHEILKSDLDWLVTEEAKNGFRFGFELGQQDKDFLLLPMLLEAQRKAVDKKSFFFLSGYFNALHFRNKDKWEGELDKLADDANLHQGIPELTWRSGMSDRAAKRILRLASASLLPLENLNVFRLGGVIGSISCETFCEWQETLIESRDKEALYLALDLHSYYFLHRHNKEKLPETLTLHLLTHSILADPSSHRQGSHMNGYHWEEIAKKFIDEYPSKAVAIGEFVLNNYGKEGTIFEAYDSYSITIFSSIIEKHPAELWDKLGECLLSKDNRSYYLSEWLGGRQLLERKMGSSIVCLVPRRILWDWLDKDPTIRAPIFASIVPQSALYLQEKFELLKEFLARYGKIEKVGSELIFNFGTEGWSGAASLHYQERKEALLEFIKNETNETVLKWTKTYLDIVEEEIRQAKIYEERRGF